MTNRREHPRLPRRIQVRFWRRGKPEETFHGFTSDLSARGAHIVTPTPLGTNSRIRVEMLTEHGGFVAEAVVRRSSRVHRELQAVRSSGMGVRFLGIEELIRELLPAAGVPTADAEVPEMPDVPETAGTAPEPAVAAAPRSPVHPASPAPAKTGAAPRLEVPVRFQGLDELRQIFERDLQHGGMFLNTSRPAPVGTRIRVALYLPGASSPLLADAQVVQVFEPPSPRLRTAPNHASGMGVLFDDPAPVIAKVRPLLPSPPAARS
jgi:hypothetical protein